MDGTPLLARTTHIGVLVFTEVIHGINSVFLEIRERFEKLGDIDCRHEFERRMGGMGQLYRVTQRMFSLNGRVRVCVGVC